MRRKRSLKNKIRINTTITGEPASWLDEWKRRGLVTSYRDAILQGLRALHDKITEQDLRAIRLENTRDGEEEW